ncbi:Galactosyl transferase GMA12/MNN10 family protein [Perilla frutescens var. hirtella]|uniref:Galactosyl transferase GMA12/MNN10 family protein n=1 Tax=Perilla frutescens var. hirtella TaxID=608512 RepID=A0AAD4J090_PERFH|nr:Galactosyl transferase GMA12/MNN10 family protein [Perilla frutescens var. hirtella]
MAKHTGRTKAASFLSDGFRLAAAALVAFMLVWTLWSSFIPTPTPTPALSTPTFPDRTSAATTDATPSVSCNDNPGPDLRHDPPQKNFYDDPKLSYTIDSPPVKNWDEKRRAWLEQHPSFAAGAENRIFMVTGSQAAPCKNPIGDYMLLKLFKNKVDYCRRHGIDIFYNNVLLQPKMFSFWAKTAAVKAAMLAHPESEWIWWVDSDAAFTDMDFEVPLHRYKEHNLVVHGWPRLVHERRTWTGINAGVFLIRNCQWGIDFIDVWASMGPQSPEYGKWGKTLSSMFKDKIFPESDDQSGLIYLYLKEEEKWGNKIYVEGEYYFEGYWLEIVETLDNITGRYLEIEKNAAALRRRHAEKVSERYGRVWEEHLKEAGYGKGSWRRPFITHFTGCQPCSGDHNQMYSGQTCFDAMQKALSFADNQVLRNYGFLHPHLLDPSTVNPLPFDYPASSI